MEYKVLGARGSIPVSGKQFEKYGGATACSYIVAGDKLIVFDCGSGIMSMEEAAWQGREVIFLISHCHIDHLLGFTMSKMFFTEDLKITVMAPSYAGNVKEALDGLMKEPLWPVGTSAFKADVRFEVMPEEGVKLHLDGDDEPDIFITHKKIFHPGGACAYKVEIMNRAFEKSVQFGEITEDVSEEIEDFLKYVLVYATDWEASLDDLEAFIEFTKGCDIIVIDGQYTDIDRVLYNGFGHNSMREAAEIGRRIRADRTVIFHHAPFHDDELLESWEKELQAAKTDEKHTSDTAQFKYPGLVFAREGMVIPFAN